MTLCPLCKGEVDAASSRHLDEDGQVMTEREDIVFCRPEPEEGSLFYWTTQADLSDCPPAMRRMLGMWGS